MLVVAAFLGWGGLLYQSYQRFQPTDFYVDNSQWSDDIVAVLDALGIDQAGYHATAESYGTGSSAAHRTLVRRLPLSNADRAGFLDAFQKRVRDKLTSGECTLKQNVGGSGDSEVRILGYRRKAVAGAIHICLFPAGDGEARLVVTMHEQRAWRRDVDVGVKLIGDAKTH